MSNSNGANYEKHEQQIKSLEKRIEKSETNYEVINEKVNNVTNQIGKNSVVMENLDSTLIGINDSMIIMSKLMNDTHDANLKQTWALEAVNKKVNEIDIKVQANEKFSTIDLRQVKKQKVTKYLVGGALGLAVLIEFIIIIISKTAG